MGGGVTLPLAAAIVADRPGRAITHPRRTSHPIPVHPMTGFTAPTLGHSGTPLRNAANVGRLLAEDDADELTRDFGRGLGLA